MLHAVGLQIGGSATATVRPTDPGHPQPHKDNSLVVELSTNGASATIGSTARIRYQGIHFFFQLFFLEVIHILKAYREINVSIAYARALSMPGVCVLFVDLSRDGVMHAPSLTVNSVSSHCFVPKMHVFFCALTLWKGSVTRRPLYH